MLDFLAHIIFDPIEGDSDEGDTPGFVFIFPTVVILMSLFLVLIWVLITLQSGVSALSHLIELKYNYLVNNFWQIGVDPLQDGLSLAFVCGFTAGIMCIGGYYDRKLFNFIFSGSKGEF